MGVPAWDVQDAVIHKRRAVILLSVVLHVSIRIEFGFSFFLFFLDIHHTSTSSQRDSLLSLLEKKQRKEAKHSHYQPQTNGYGPILGLHNGGLTLPVSKG